MSAKRFLQKIKQVFGLSGGRGSDTERPGDRRTDVTVERETEPTPPGTTEPAVDESADDSPSPSTEETTETESATSAETDETEETSEPVDDIKGIGPTYSDRLAAAGIETVADLADAEPDAVADAAQTGSTKAANWIERAQHRE